MSDNRVGPWRKSSRSAQQGNCVEVAPSASGGRRVRDSKQPDAGFHQVSRSAWTAFLKSVKDGRFD